jgi:hypothetical protein
MSTVKRGDRFGLCGTKIALLGRETVWAKTQICVRACCVRRWPPRCARWLPQCVNKASSTEGHVAHLLGALLTSAPSDKHLLGRLLHTTPSRRGNATGGRNPSAVGGDCLSMWYLWMGNGFRVCLGTGGESPGVARPCPFFPMVSGCLGGEYTAAWVCGLVEALHRATYMVSLATHAQSGHGSRLGSRHAWPRHSMGFATACTTHPIRVFSRGGRLPECLPHTRAFTQHRQRFFGPSRCPLASH